MVFVRLSPARVPVIGLEQRRRSAGMCGVVSAWIPLQLVDGKGECPILTYCGFACICPIESMQSIELIFARRTAYATL
jgi:hypothetical protein